MEVVDNELSEAVLSGSIRFSVGGRSCTNEVARVRILHPWARADCDKPICISELYTAKKRRVLRASLGGLLLYSLNRRRSLHAIPGHMASFVAQEAFALRFVNLRLPAFLRSVAFPVAVYALHIRSIRRGRSCRGTRCSRRWESAWLGRSTSGRRPCARSLVEALLHESVDFSDAVDRRKVHGKDLL